MARYYAENAEARPERRGGAHKVTENEEKKKLVMNHIQTFTCRASHYGRRGAPGRKYLPSDLSVKRMHDLFKQQNHDAVSYSPIQFQPCIWTSSHRRVFYMCKVSSHSKEPQLARRGEAYSISIFHFALQMSKGVL